MAAAGVIGAGAMGMGVVQSLLRNGFAVHVRDIREEASTMAHSLGATCHAFAADVVAACRYSIILVVDAAQVEDVLFGAGGATSSRATDSVVMIGSTIAPEDVARFAQRAKQAGIVVLDTPVSGGPARAADGTMTMMASGDRVALDGGGAMLAAIAGKVFRVGEEAGDAAHFKVINNMLAAANLAAGAEALALAQRAGLDPRLVLDVVNASSGASWIVADRMPRALAADYAPRAASRILAKDAALAVALARRHGVESRFAQAAAEAFAATVSAGYGEDDDAAIYEWSRTRWR
jgi:3-hydroxyisobutyrate dehydrogenase-like beta-hydroxyacid dehydrogenase